MGITVHWSCSLISLSHATVTAQQLGPNITVNITGSEPAGTTLREPRFTGKTRITGKTAEIPERPKNNRELKYDIHLVYA